MTSKSDKNERMFYIDTPIGRIKVWAKHSVDDPEDYPGVYIDVIPNGNRDDNADENMCSVVEYDSVNKCIQTCVYQPYSDEPVAIIRRSTNA